MPLLLIVTLSVLAALVLLGLAGIVVLAVMQMRAAAQIDSHWADRIDAYPEGRILVLLFGCGITADRSGPAAPSEAVFQKAYEVYQQYGGAAVLAGIGSGYKYPPGTSEAIEGVKWLSEAGVPEIQIVEEPGSYTTFQNALCFAAAIRRDWEKIILVADHHHARRCLLTVRALWKAIGVKREVIGRVSLLPAAPCPYGDVYAKPFLETEAGWVRQNKKGILLIPFIAATVHVARILRLYRPQLSISAH